MCWSNKAGELLTSFLESIHVSRRLCVLFKQGGGVVNVLS